MNSFYDRVRGIMDSKSFTNPDILVPEPQIYYGHVQKIYFGLNTEGNRDRLTSIIGHFHGDGISGLSFLYESHAVISVGYTHTDDNSIVKLGDRGQIIQISAMLARFGTSAFEVSGSIPSFRFNTTN